LRRSPPEPVIGEYSSTRKREARPPFNANERRTEMGKIVVIDNVSLDGVIQDPGR
jgi:predicted O-methyltransferase YrrM